MRDQRRLLAVGLGLAVLAATVLVAPTPARAAGELPRWTVGDFWAFRGNAPGVGPVMATFTVQGVDERLAVAGFTGTTYRASMQLAAGPAFAVDVTTSFTVAGLAIVRQVASLPGFASGVDYNPPLENIRFPLEAGLAWNQTTNITAMIEGDATNRIATTFYDVAAGIAVVPKGRFEGFAIQSRSSASGAVEGIAVYADRVGYFVQMGISPFLGNATGLELTDFRYAAGETRTRGLDLVLWTTVSASGAAGVAIALFWGRHKRRARARRGTDPDTAPPRRRP